MAIKSRLRRIVGHSEEHHPAKPDGRTAHNQEAGNSHLNGHFAVFLIGVYQARLRSRIFLSNLVVEHRGVCRLPMEHHVLLTGVRARKGAVLQFLRLQAVSFGRDLTWCRINAFEHHET